MNDLIDRQAAIDTDGLDEEIRCEMCMNPMHTNRGCDGNCRYDEKLYKKIIQILDKRIKPLPSALPEPRNKNNAEVISILSDMRSRYNCFDPEDEEYYRGLSEAIKALSAQPEPLTDKEQRIFLLAMGKEKEVCKEVDNAWRNCREPYEDSLVSVCNKITRKVKGALWI